MQTTDSVEREIQKLYQKEQLAVFSTEHNCQPYVSLVTYAATMDIGTIIP